MRKWKLLFFVFLAICLVDLGFMPFQDDIGISHFVSAILGLTVLIPLYGFAYQVPVGNKVVAITICGFNAIIMGGFMILNFIQMLGDISVARAISFLIACGFAFLLMYPQYMYAFKSDKIWQST